MAAALHAKILAEGYTPNMLRPAGSATSETARSLQRHFMQLKVPQRLAAPQPQRQKTDYARILEWEQKGKEGVIVSPPDSATGYGDRTQQSLHQLYIESVLVQSYARLRRRELDLAWTKASRRAASNEVRSWPPAPSQPASALNEESQLCFDAVQGREVNTSPRKHLTPQRAVSSRPVDVPSIDYIEGPGARPEGSPNSFIDSDGLEWPLPPRECWASPAPDVVPGSRAPPRSTLVSMPASMEGFHPTHSPTTFNEDDGIRGSPPRQCMAAPNVDSLPRERGMQALARSDRPSDRTTSLLCDLRRTSPGSSTTPSPLPLTPADENDERHRPCVAPPGVGIIGEGRPSSKTATRPWGGVEAG